MDGMIDTIELLPQNGCNVNHPGTLPPPSPSSPVLPPPSPVPSLRPLHSPLPFLPIFSPPSSLLSSLLSPLSSLLSPLSSLLSPLSLLSRLPSPLSPSFFSHFHRCHDPPILYANMNSWKGDTLQIVKLLVKYGATVNSHVIDAFYGKQEILDFLKTVKVIFKS